MNRSLGIPAGCCLFAFAALWVALQASDGQEPDACQAALARAGRHADLGTSPALPASPVSPTTGAYANGPALLSIEQAEQLLTGLAGEYLRPWREWASSPRRLFSRVAPRPIPAIDALVEMSPGAISEGDRFVLATIAIRIGPPSDDALPQRIPSQAARTETMESQLVPCFVDRTTQQVRLFADGQWLTSTEWLKTAPLPQGWRGAR
jgi:hypothetical protein